MNWTIHQTICIGHLRVNSVTNSSVLQIGSAGMISSLSNLYNTGGFTGPAPQLGQQIQSETNPISLVPLPPVNRVV
ncbi:spore germination protein GerPB [Paenibacillus sp. GP183]|jgi:spore germination protein PB|uniref:spore germination protein GerPB n=1 Tax=Paenibacillus sp. GP183 TaxID=1882751 RepID=UPI0008996718|nr:spore germination protein GerPB [Paenibacillus sp. GP183]SEC50626.1 spore germination protein PB [Paenibacillus sp. GP183]